MGKNSARNSFVFRGRYEHAIDDKGRLSIPARFREILAEQRQDGFILTNFNSCLVAYPLQEWHRLEEKIRPQSSFQREVLDFLRLFYSNATEVTLDNQGRILIPPELRRQAALQRAVIIVGVLNRIEIWGKERWEQFVAERSQTFEEIASKLAELGI
ncbi:MAG: division/cell wall cluster transcriptional repressor MraZ [candidate division NC10 bacterium]|nr:division/cell wall cluster transcriptional repressor MraZ [candidate division NC10 bacterium]